MMPPRPSVRRNTLGMIAQLDTFITPHHGLRTIFRAGRMQCAMYFGGDQHASEEAPWLGAWSDDEALALHLRQVEVFRTALEMVEIID